ncbi:hypothetical protein BH11ACT8_BH11ACT8_18640 [soil metagenome]
MQFATSGAKDPLTTLSGLDDEIVGGADYQDWRTEVMGYFQVEV